jgi:hypothetical protein
MSSKSKDRAAVLELSEFIKQLDESVRVEAFRFLLPREIGEDGEATVAARPRGAKMETDRPVAPQELIRRSAVSTFIEKAVVLAYWLEEFQQHPTFSSSDLRTAFESAREHSPKNTSDLIAKLEGSGRVMRAEKTGGVQQYRLTSSAIHDVQRWLGAEEV